MCTLVSEACVFLRNVCVCVCVRVRVRVRVCVCAKSVSVCVSWAVLDLPSSPWLTHDHFYYIIPGSQGNRGGIVEHINMSLCGVMPL